MAGLGDVNVKLTLDDSSARATIKNFFADLGNQKQEDPLKKIDKSFERVAKAAKHFVFYWNKAMELFIVDIGFSATHGEMDANI